MLPRLSSRSAVGLVAAVVAAVTLARLWPLTHRIFNWDECGLLSRAYQLTQQGFTLESRPGLVRLLLAPLFWLLDSHVPILFAGRGLALVALVGLLYGLWRLARVWYGAGPAWMALLLLSFHTAFFVHSVELRTEIFSTSLALCGLAWAELRARSSRSPLPGAALVGLAALCSQKAVYVVAWYALAKLLGLGVRISALWWRRALMVAAIPGVVLLAAVATVSPEDMVPFVERLTIGALGEARTPFYQEWVQWTYVRWSLKREPFFYALPFLTLPVLFHRRRWLRRKAAAALLLQGLTAGILWFHAARFPYFFLTIAPMWALPAGYQLYVLGAWLLRARRPLARALGRVGAAAALALMAYFPAQQRAELLVDNIDSQLEFIRTLEGVFPPGTPAFDASHLMFMHQQVEEPFYARDVWKLRTQPGVAEDLVSRLRVSRPVYYLQGKRVEDFPPLVQRYLDEHFVRVGPNLYVAGAQLERSGWVDVVKPGRYRVMKPRPTPEMPMPPPGAREIFIDGRAVRLGRSVELDVMKVPVDLDGGGVRLRLDWPGLDAIERPGHRNRLIFRGYR